MDDQLWGLEYEIKDFSPFIPDGELPSKVDWNKLDYDDATAYYSEKFSKFPPEIVEILNNCHNKDLKKAKKEALKREGKKVLKIQRGIYTIDFN